MLSTEAFHKRGPDVVRYMSSQRRAGEMVPGEAVKTAKELAMGHLKTLLIATPVALGLLLAPTAHAQSRYHGGGGYHGHHGYSHGGGGGRGALAGVIAGVGVAAILGGLLAAQSQPAPVYAPPPGYYPGYYPAPGYWR
jgi:hypothetical protein